VRPPAWLRLPIPLLAVAALIAAAVPGSAAAAPALMRRPPFYPAALATSCTAANAVDSLRPLGPPQVTPGSWMDTIRHRGYLIAGVTQSTYPFGFYNPLDGQTEGFEIDILHAIAKAIFGKHPKIEFRAISDAQRAREVQSGAVDIVAHTMTILCKRLKMVDFSSVYFDAGAQVLVLKDSRAKGLADLGGKKVCATATSDSIGYIKAARTPIPFVAPNFTDCLMLLQQGDVAAISTDNSILAGLRHQDPWTKIVGRPFSSEPYGLAISKKHGDFVRFVNAVLQQMRTDGQWAADYRRWVGTPVPAPPRAQYKA
jgi:polar amino acid transport system substrate-binding protein